MIEECPTGQIVSDEPYLYLNFVIFLSLAPLTYHLFSYDMQTA